MLEQHRTISVEEIAAGLADVATGTPDRPEAKVVQADFGKKPAATPLMTRPTYVEKATLEDAAREAAFVASFNDEKAKRAEELEAIEEPLERFKRALGIERRAAAGQVVGEAEARWLNGYQTTGEYRGQRKMHEDFGDTMFLN